MNIRTVALLLTVTLAPAVSASAAPPAPISPQELLSQLTALEARVSKLEGNIVASDLVGTYNLIVLDTVMNAAPNGGLPANISTSATRATLTLNANGTGSFAGVSSEGTNLALGTWTLSGNSCNDCGDSDLTWVYADGVITTTDGSGEELPFAVALGGRFLILAGAPFHPSDPSSDQLLLIATRLQ